MTTLGKYEKYLIEEFFDDYRAGTMSHGTFTRRVAFITGSMASASAAMLLVGCTPDEVPRGTDPMPTPSPASSGTRPVPVPVPAPGAGPGPGSWRRARHRTRHRHRRPVPGAKSPLSVPEGEPGLVTETVRFPSDGTDISAYLARPESGAAGPAVLICHENRGLTAHIEDVARRFAKAGYAALALDLLSREGGTAKMDRDAVPGALTAAGAQRHVGDFAAAFDYLQSKHFVAEGRIAMNGYCFGGESPGNQARSLWRLRRARPADHRRAPCAAGGAGRHRCPPPAHGISRRRPCLPQ